LTIVQYARKIIALSSLYNLIFFLFVSLEISNISLGVYGAQSLEFQKTRVVELYQTTHVTAVCRIKACPHQATNCCSKRQHCRSTCQSRRFWQQFVAVSGNNSLSFSVFGNFVAWCGQALSSTSFQWHSRWHPPSSYDNPAI